MKEKRYNTFWGITHVILTTRINIFFVFLLYLIIQYISKLHKTHRTFKVKNIHFKSTTGFYYNNIIIIQTRQKQSRNKMFFAFIYDHEYVKSDQDFYGDAIISFYPAEYKDKVIKYLKSLYCL